MMSFHSLSFITMVSCAAVLSACGGDAIEGETLAECIDGVDNDDDGQVDCLDSDCLTYGVCWGDTGVTQSYDTEDSWVQDVEPTDGSAVIINEFMASNRAAVQDVDSPAADPSFPDWIELFNTTSAEIALEGYTITDDLAVPDKHSLSGELVLPAGGYLLLWADDDEEKEGADHLGFQLAREGEEIGLYDPKGNALCAIEYGPQASDYSASALVVLAATSVQSVIGCS